MKRWVVLLGWCAGLTAFAHSAAGQVVHIIEAEACEVTHAGGQAPTVHDSVMASGCQRIGNFWGEQAGDEIAWTIEPPRRMEGLTLGIRYSFDAAHYRQMRGDKASDRTLRLLIDGEPVGEVHVPDTGGWENYATAYIELPRLERGQHRFTLRSPSDAMTTDLDTFTFFRGSPEAVLTPAWRNTTVIRSQDGRFTVRMTARAVVQFTPEQILHNFNRIYEFFKGYMGWEPDRGVIHIHIYEDALARGAYENGAGIHFEASNFNWDRGNWIHEMNHVFDNGLFPAWTGHPMIRLNDTFVTGPGCFPELWKGPEADPNWAARLAAGQRLLDDPTFRTDNPNDVLYALAARYGRDILFRFYRECREAKARGEIRFERGAPLTTQEYLRLLSRAAGEDVTRYFHQWRGFADVQ